MSFPPTLLSIQMAPEVLRGDGNANEKCDVFSAGVVLWELVTGLSPWKELREPFLLMKLVGDQGARLTIPDDIQPEVAQLLKDCWAEVPSERPSFKDMIDRLSMLKELIPSVTAAAQEKASKKVDQAKRVTQAW